MRGEPVNIALVKRDILDSLAADPEYRHAWNFENVYTSLCFQISALREQREWSQSKLGRSAGMAQERISILEDPNAATKPTLNTLLRIADAFDVGLDVKFIPYGTVLDRSTRTNIGELEVPSFEDELPELLRIVAAEIKWADSGQTKRIFKVEDFDWKSAPPDNQVPEYTNTNNSMNYYEPREAA
jgi:transcriptional regulator with XRE-family HTH domain